MIKAIIFDCFGVLTVTDRWHEFRLSLAPDLQTKASELNQQSCRGEITKDQFLTAVTNLTTQPRQDIKDIIDNASDKNLELLIYIKTLKTNYKIGLLSNVESDWILDSFLTKEEQKLFDTFVFSFEVGMTKPDPRIFKLAAERLQVKPEECLFVDDINRYCEAAQAEGMRKIHYQDFSQFRIECERLLADNA